MADKGAKVDTSSFPSGEQEITGNTGRVMPKGWDSSKDTGGEKTMGKATKGSSNHNQGSEKSSSSHT